MYELSAQPGEAITASGIRPDYGSGPYLGLMASAVRLARTDLSNPLYSEEAKSFLEGDLVALFADCLGIDAGRFKESA